jgi:flagellar assembly protein FliH
MTGFQERLERDLFRFALAVAERIVRREVMMDDATILRQVKDAIRRVVGVESIRLRIHPQDEAVVRQHRPGIIASVDSLRDVVVEPDAAVEPGGCIIDSSSGNVDARISTQLQQIETALFGVRPSTQEVS